MWDSPPTDQDIDKLAPLVGRRSLPFLVELGMDFAVWERIFYRQSERDLVKLNQDILEEWRGKFCQSLSIKPTLRGIAQAFINIDMSLKMVENALFD